MKTIHFYLGLILIGGFALKASAYPTAGTNPTDQTAENRRRAVASYAADLCKSVRNSVWSNSKIAKDCIGNVSDSKYLDDNDVYSIADDICGNTLILGGAHDEVGGQCYIQAVNRLPLKPLRGAIQKCIDDSDMWDTRFSCMEGAFVDADTKDENPKSIVPN